jgi:spore coat protein U-like protein
VIRSKQLLAAAAMVSSALVLSGAQAATDTTTFSVTASIVDACDVQATNHAFGPYSASAGSALDATSDVNVYCTSGTTYTIALNVGTGGGAFTGRKMTSGGSELVYNLYTTAARNTVWGDGSGSTATVGGTGAGLLTASAHTVYGRVGTGQDSAPGSYSSTITVTLNF